MLPPKLDPIADNPFVLLGLDPRNLVAKGFEEAWKLAFDFGQFMLGSFAEELDSGRRHWISSCLDVLRDEEFARAAFESLKQFTNFHDVISRLEKTGFERERRMNSVGGEIQGRLYARFARPASMQTELSQSHGHRLVFRT